VLKKVVRKVCMLDWKALVCWSSLDHVAQIYLKEVGALFLKVISETC